MSGKIINVGHDDELVSHRSIIMQSPNWRLLNLLTTYQLPLSEWMLEWKTENTTFYVEGIWRGGLPKNAVWGFVDIALFEACLNLVTGLHKLWNLAIPNWKVWSNIWEPGKHGNDGKHQPGDLKCSIHNSITLFAIQDTLFGNESNNSISGYLWQQFKKL